MESISSKYALNLTPRQEGEMELFFGNLVSAYNVIVDYYMGEDGDMGLLRRSPIPESIKKSLESSVRSSLKGSETRVKKGVEKSAFVSKKERVNYLTHKG